MSADQVLRPVQAPRRASSRFLKKRFANADLTTRVRLMMPVARTIVQHGVAQAAGIDQLRRTTGDLSEVLEPVIGFDPNGDGDATREEIVSAAMEGRDAAYTLGIAVGLLLHLDAFEQSAETGRRRRRQRSVVVGGSR